MILVFAVFKSKKISFLLLIAAVAFLLLFIYEERLSRNFYGVNQEVSFLNKNMSGLFENEVREVIKKVSPKFSIAPVSAIVKKNSRNEIVPHLSGWQLNEDLTLQKIMQANHGETIEPVFENILPTITLQDFPHLPVYRGNPVKKEIALMINVAWGEEYIAQIVEILQENETKSTFFNWSLGRKKSRHCIIYIRT